MPGNWIRLRAGRKARRNSTSGLEIMQIIPASSVPAIPGVSGGRYHLVEIRRAASVDIVTLDLQSGGGWIMSEVSPLEAIPSTYDYGAFSYPKAAAQLSDSVIFYNGMAVRLASSIPGLTQWTPPSTVRYYGLYPVSSGTVPTATFAPGAGHNSVTAKVKIYAGLHNTATQHYSNAVSTGEIGPTGTTGVITINFLNSILAPFHGAAEQAELQYVFYATIDGFDVPYLIMNAAQDGPYTVPYGSSSASLSISANTVNGWVLDLSKERPVRNYPPRGFRSLCAANGRLYGVLSPTHVATNAVEYTFTNKDLAGVFWSEAEGSVRTSDFLGDPLQSWPPSNFSATPSAERPLHVHPAPNGIDVMVWTPTHTWLLREQADGYHEWDAASRHHGLIAQASTVVTTRHGVCWVTQRNQVAMYGADGSLQILSADYDALLRGKSVTCAVYVYDPLNQLDRYQVFFSDQGVSRSLCHDFRTGAYTTTEPDEVFCGATIGDIYGLQYHVIGAGQADVRAGIYTIEGQPDVTYGVPLKDESFLDSATQIISAAEIGTGVYVSNWSDQGAAWMRKEIPFVDVLGDAGASAALGGVPALTLRYFEGFARPVVSANGTLAAPAFKLPQEEKDFAYRFKIAARHWTWWKLMFELQAHSGDLTAGHYTRAEDYADIGHPNSFYGSIAKAYLAVGPARNVLG
jgi:hypothetical protein